MSVSQWLLPLAFMGLISCQVGVGTAPPQPSNTPTPAPSATPTVFSPKQTALIKKYTEKGVNPLLLTLFFKSESGLTLKKDEDTPLTVHSTRYPEDALALKTYLEPLPLSHVKEEKTSEGQIFFRLFFSEAVEVETLMAEMKQFPFVQSVSLNVIPQDGGIAVFRPTLQGKVFDTDGNPVANATVTLRAQHVFTNNSLFELTRQTDKEGEYRIPYPGEFQALWVIANKPGYLTVEQKFTPHKNHRDDHFVDFGVAQGNSATALTATDISPKQEALLKTYAQQRVSPYLLNLSLHSESDFTLHKDEGSAVSVRSSHQPKDASTLQTYLEGLPLKRIHTISESPEQPFMSLVFSKVTDLGQVMDQLNAFPFVQSVQFNYDASNGQFQQLEGQVFDTTGNPVPYASLTLKSLAIVPGLKPDSPFTYTVKADKNGKYKIAFPEELKQVSVSVSKPGYMPLEHTIATESFSTFFDFGGRYSKPNTALKPAP